MSLSKRKCNEPLKLLSNMKPNKSQGRLLAGAIRPGETRSVDDWYRTPPEALDALFNVLPPEWRDLGHIWENACGDGVLVDRLIELGYSVYGSDIADRSNGRFDQIDFLNDDISGMYFDTILTNPPYRYVNDWIDRSIRHADTVIILSKLQLLESEKRYLRFKNENGSLKWNLKAIFPFSKRLTLWRSHIDHSKRKGSGTIPYAWFIFDKNHSGNMVYIDWILL